MQRLFSGTLALSLLLLGSPVANAETTELVTYYPTLSNLGQANLDAATIGNIGETPDPGELLVESRVRIGLPSSFEAPDSNLAIFTNIRNMTSGLAYLSTSHAMPNQPTGPFLPGQTNSSDFVFLTMSQPNQNDTALLNWRMMTTWGENDEPSLTFAREYEPNSGSSTWKSLMTMDWDGLVGINNEFPEAMLHIGSSTNKGDILLENTRGIKVKDNTGTPQYILSYTSANNTYLQQNAATGGMLFSVNNNHQTGDIYFRTGLDNPNTPEDEALRMSIENSGSVVIKGDLIVDGKIRSYSDTVEVGNGDTNGDGIITPIDVLLPMGYVAQRDPMTPEQIQRADMNGDGYISSVDAELISDKLERNGNGSSAGPFTTHHVSQKHIHENTLIIDSHRSAGIGNSPVDFPSPANNSRSENLTVNDIYVKSTNQWMSQGSGGVIKAVSAFILNMNGLRQGMTEYVLIDLRNAVPTIADRSTGSPSIAHSRSTGFSNSAGYSNIMATGSMAHIGENLTNLVATPRIEVFYPQQAYAPGRIIPNGHIAIKLEMFDRTNGHPIPARWVSIAVNAFEY